MQKDFDLSVDLALGFIYKCLHQDGVYKSEILSIKERIVSEDNEELLELELEDILINENEFAVLYFELSYERLYYEGALRSNGTGSLSQRECKAQEQGDFGRILFAQSDSIKKAGL
ncbi:baseplate assembly protein J [Campylobacter jejuni subsp. doylei]|uniref:Baseplate assembly protein J n=1 Tax=Campylobacter jejuni subsp. doylei TaxID=32021 RepID=A0A448JE60_CAMJU|nr:baseplate assembly protein J [Campylobacter jejuni subsp. doylei]